MAPKSTSTILSLIALVALPIAVIGLIQAARMREDVDRLDKTAQVNTRRALAAEEKLSKLDVAATPVPLPPARAGAATSVIRRPWDVPPPLNRSEPTTVRIALTTTEMTAELADGATYDFWTFNQTVPGPMLRVMEGDLVELTIHNPVTSTTPHNIDLHAVNGPGGGAAVTGVMPGETKVFKFTALHAGAFVYHCAYTPPMHHIAQGMYGTILVEPKGGLPKVDREFYVMQGEWYTMGDFGAKGHLLHSAKKALAETPDYVTFNGRVDALTKKFPLEAKQGETIRLFFGTGGPNVGSNFHVIGEVFDRVYLGRPDVFAANEETVYVPPGSSGIFEFKLDVPGEYLLVDHALYRVSKGAAGVLKVTGEWNDAIYFPHAPGASH